MHARTLWILILAAILLPGTSVAQPATQIDLHGPPGSEAFGTQVTVLPNGNVIVTDPLYDAGGVVDVGAVYLYHGATHQLISTLTGSQPGDRVGWAVTALSNGNFVVRSSAWANGTITNTGAVTWGNGTTGITGTVSPANSLVGSQTGDLISLNVTALSNGNYVVSSPYWANGTVFGAGAVTWGNGTTGITGTVSPANSLVGSHSGDEVGFDGVVALSNGNYVVRSPYWDHRSGAVTWGNGSTGITGTVSPANSLTRTTQVYGEIREPYSVTGTSRTVSPANSLTRTTQSYGSDSIIGVTELSNGNFVVSSPGWDNGTVTKAGAVTWVSGTHGLTGTVSPTNSLIGSHSGDYVGSGGVTALSNGNYVVSSPSWANGTVTEAGAVTWVRGTTSITGTISPANSLIGSHSGDLLGFYGVTALSNGNYVVSSPSWDNGTTTNAGAVTWGNGTTGLRGTVSPANSLVGSQTDDLIFLNVTALSNGNYVVSSPSWANGTVSHAGAVTWANGSTGLSGTISPANSLVGTQTYDRVGDSVTALSNGNYVVSSPDWTNGTGLGVGAVTWANGSTGIHGTISPTNSLIGSQTGDLILLNVTALSNGNYVVSSPYWANGAVLDVGAVTWANGSTGITGTVSPANSLVGTQTFDQVGYSVTALSDGNYVIDNPWCASEVGTPSIILVETGAITWGTGSLGSIGTISATNSVRGLVADGGVPMTFDYDATRHYLIVGRPEENIVTFFGPLNSGFDPANTLYLPLVRR